MKTKTPKPNPQLQIDENELRILRASADRFMTHGYSKVTLDEVAADLRISKKTVYKFFPGKDILLRAIIRSMLRRLEAKMDEIVASDKPSDEKFLALFMLLGGVIRRMTRQFQLDLQRFAPAVWDEAEAFRRERLFPKLQAIFRQAREQGLFRNEINSELFFLIFTSTVQSVMNLSVLSQQPFSAEEAFLGIFRIMFTGVLTEDAKPAFDKLVCELAAQQNTELI